MLRSQVIQCVMVIVSRSCGTEASSPSDIVYLLTATQLPKRSPSVAAKSAQWDDRSHWDREFQSCMKQYDDDGTSRATSVAILTFCGIKGCFDLSACLGHSTSRYI